MSDIDAGATGGDKKLNQLVAVTVVALAVFLGLCHIKDENLVQAMQQAQSNAVDAWSEYQATRIKLHVSQDTLETLESLGRGGRALEAKRSELKADIAKYGDEAPKLEAQAKGYEDQYNKLNFHDDQFDACDALIGIAISAAAVASLAETLWVLWAAWGFAAFGVLMGVCGFAGWPIHPDFLASFLG